MKTNDEQLLKEYFFTFFEFPPALMCVNFRHPMYVSLMKKAIKKGTPITIEDIDKYMEKHPFQYDVYIPTEEEKKKEKGELENGNKENN